MHALEEVVRTLNLIDDKSFKRDMIVFDNASTFPGSVELLKNNFSNVIQCKQNVGFWSGIQWVIKNHESVLGRSYKYLYVIESDCIHTLDAFEKLQHCEKFLDENEDVGFIRTEEFSIKNRHLYNKRQQYLNSVRYAWVTQDNFLTGKDVEFEGDTSGHGIHKCNFLAKVPVLSRMNVMEQIFEKLSSMGQFTEMDYQRFYWEKYPKSAILDGGIWDSKLGNTDPSTMVTGSWSVDESVGYRQTRKDSIEKVDLDDVVRIS